MVARYISTSPGYRASFFTFERHAHAQPVDSGPRACAVMYRRPSCVPMRRNREKRLTYAIEICPEAQKQAKWYINIYAERDREIERDSIGSNSPSLTLAVRSLTLAMIPMIVLLLATLATTISI